MSSYLSNVLRRKSAWTMLCQKPSLPKINAMVGIGSKAQKEQLWNVVNHIHYHVKSIATFMLLLSELAVEEKVTFTSHSTPEKVRKWLKQGNLNDDMAELSDSALMFVFFAMRDGESFFKREMFTNV